MVYNEYKYNTIVYILIINHIFKYVEKIKQWLTICKRKFQIKNNKKKT